MEVGAVPFEPVVVIVRPAVVVDFDLVAAHFGHRGHPDVDGVPDVDGFQLHSPAEEERGGLGVVPEG